MTARSWTCCSSPPAAARRKPIWAWRPSRWSCGACAIPGIASAGLSVLMRYTLRLLTLDQLGRAATLICALELERQQDVDKLGDWPFEIGLWVGRAATPNRMGQKGDNDPESARAKTIAFKNDDRKPSPIPLEECPWCGTKFTRQLVPAAAEPGHADRPARHLRQPRLRLQPRQVAADPGGRRTDLPPAALLPDRHGRQVRGDALDRPGRRVLRPGRAVRPARVLRPLRADTSGTPLPAAGCCLPT